MYHLVHYQVTGYLRFMKNILTTPMYQFHHLPPLSPEGQLTTPRRSLNWNPDSPWLEGIWHLKQPINHLLFYTSFKNNFLLINLCYVVIRLVTKNTNFKTNFVLSNLYCETRIQVYVRILSSSIIPVILTFHLKNIKTG